jgi:hypothetical protein
MRLLSKLVFGLLSCLLISATSVEIEAPHILHYAQTHLPQIGPLEMTPEGFVYVKVPDDYIFALIEKIGKEEIESPPYFGEGKVGAHISVIDASEAKNKQLDLPLIGRNIRFSIKNLAYVEIDDGKGQGRRIYFLTIHSPELERLRLCNGFSRQIRGADLHITIGVEYLTLEEAS